MLHTEISTAYDFVGILSWQREDAVMQSVWSDGLRTGLAFQIFSGELWSYWKEMARQTGPKDWDFQ